MRIAKKLSLSLAILLFLGACVNGPGVPKEKTGIPGDLAAELKRTTESNATSADNALNQAKVAYGTLAGRLLTNPIDSESYQLVREKIQPPLFIAASSLADSANKDDFRQIYFDTLTNMFRGINNNMLIYQSSIEAAQITDANVANALPPVNDEIITGLANIFLATEATEFFISQFGQFKTIVAEEETAKILIGIKNQQTTIVNGIVNFTNRKMVSGIQSKNGYQIIAKSITSPTLLPELRRLAEVVFGKENVAFLQEELTPIQTNPNLIVMVIRETDSTYRKISINEGKIVNNVVNDSRGLSASDLLNNSNVNVIRLTPSPQP